MNAIYKKMDESKELYKFGMISKSEFDKIMRGLEIDLMGCDSL